MYYIGSKKTLLPIIEQVIDEHTGLKEGKFCDLFAGTGAVGTRFREKGFTVHANDMQYYSYVLNRHLISNSAPLRDKYPEIKQYWKHITDGVIYTKYCAGSGSGRNYFTDKNGQHCDSMRVCIEQAYQNKVINEDEYFYLLAGLINSIDIVANTTGLYTSYLKHIKTAAQKSFKFEFPPVIDGIKGTVTQQDALELITELEGDILYLDPPYIGRQYSKDYHILETVARGDNPEIYGVTGRRKNGDYISPFGYKRKALGCIEQIVSQAKYKYIFLSYSNEAHAQAEDIKEMFGKYGKYDRYAHENYKRYRADNDGENRVYKADSVTEYLHILTK